MTWEEFKQKAVKFGYYQSIWEDCITNGRYDFYKTGSIVFKECIFALDRTPTQMLTIMRALKVKEVKK